MQRRPEPIPRVRAELGVQVGRREGWDAASKACTAEESSCSQSRARSKSESSCSESVPESAPGEKGWEVGWAEAAVEPREAADASEREPVVVAEEVRRCRLPSGKEIINKLFEDSMTNLRVSVELWAAKAHLGRHLYGGVCELALKIRDFLEAALREVAH